ncbi:acyl carrier protein [Ktedonosporobacter rubrisoli]|uniref:Acyl carrier protein n=1 Tax=Ktedonosporobacter rubrisoli TaxID=2509675 RepID=A0A4P6JPU8_KTERU|nr:acyl carrier protein [Ktedonosporobacter rubrisoli]QBD77180.1 acyl carrier protein [Ktedonosporobacter rubrisoli]
MQRSIIVNQLNEYIAQQILDGSNIDLQETTPLLEWGILNSLEMVRLLQFLKEHFLVDIPPEKMIPDSFVNPGAIADLIMEETNK